MCEQTTEYWVEWIEDREMLSDYPAAARKGGFSEEDIAAKEGFLDVCAPEHYTYSRRFPSLAMAIGWAMKNRERDLWREPRVSVCLYTPATYDEPDDRDEIEVWTIGDNGAYERAAGDPDRYN